MRAPCDCHYPFDCEICGDGWTIADEVAWMQAHPEEYPVLFTDEDLPPNPSEKEQHNGK